MTVLLLGDSNLARLHHDLPDVRRLALGADVECRAAGGAWSGSLRDQIGSRDLADYVAVVLSIGSSDNHPAFSSSPEIFRDNLSQALARGGRWIALIPPGVARAISRSTEEANALIKAYAEVLVELVEAVGGICVDVRSVVDRLGPAAYDPDGMHLSRAAYEDLAPALAEALGTTVS